MAYLTLIITVPLTLFALSFAFANTADVSVGLWPRESGWMLPLSALGLGMLGTGFFLGGLFVWIHYQKVRFKYWKESRRAARLEKELNALHQKMEKPAAAGPASGVPAVKQGT